MIDDIIRSINWGDIGLMGGLVLISYILRPVLLGIISNGATGHKVQREMVAALTAISGKMELDNANTTALTVAATGLTTHVKTLNDYMTQTDARMAAVTEARVRWQDALHTDLKTIPAETARLIKPDLSKIPTDTRAGIEPLITDLRQSVEHGFERVSRAIIEKIEAQGEHLTPSMRAMLKAEFDTYQKRSTAQIDNLSRMVETLRVQLQDRQEPGESVAPAPDTKPNSEQEGSHEPN